ncbi:hypothetical protein DFR75_101829 [Nocardia ignorata]|uniref:Uncharacterized protein n=1 Tax=Nocardia ignorata TaxID=145285 RepID=A0A4R6PWB3_NOCIG|nr:hypothetical protein DFR75_101829 [Nocardia ignorata]
MGPRRRHGLRHQHAHEFAQRGRQVGRRTAPGAHPNLELRRGTPILLRPGPLPGRRRRSEIVHGHPHRNRRRNQRPLRHLPGSQHRRLATGTGSPHRHPLAAVDRTFDTVTPRRNPGTNASLSARRGTRAAGSVDPGRPWRDCPRHHDHNDGPRRRSLIRRWRCGRDRARCRRPRSWGNDLPVTRWLREDRAHRGWMTGRRRRYTHRAEERKGGDQDARQCVHGTTVGPAIPERDNDFPIVDNFGTCGYRALHHGNARSASRLDFGPGPSPRRLNERFVLSSNTCARHGPTSRATRARPSGRRSQRRRSARACQREFSSG